MRNYARREPFGDRVVEEWRGGQGVGGVLRRSVEVEGTVNAVLQVETKGPRARALLTAVVSGGTGRRGTRRRRRLEHLVGRVPLRRRRVALPGRATDGRRRWSLHTGSGGPETGSGAEAGTGSGGGTGSRSYTGTGRVFSALDGADDGAWDVAAA